MPASVPKEWRHEAAATRFLSDAWPDLERFAEQTSRLATRPRLGEVQRQGERAASAFESLPEISIPSMSPEVAATARGSAEGEGTGQGWFGPSQTAAQAPAASPAQRPSALPSAPAAPAAGGLLPLTPLQIPSLDELFGTAGVPPEIRPVPRQPSQAPVIGGFQQPSGEAPSFGSFGSTGPAPRAGAASGPASAAASGPPSAPGEIEAYIRSSAAARRIDPDVAVAVARSEGGLENPVRQSEVVNAAGKREESYGPFQLYMGGGLGNAALQQGIDPRNPAQWRQAVDFALDNAAQSGWGAWYGAARVGIGNRQGIGTYSGPVPAAPPPAQPAAQPAAQPPLAPSPSIPAGAAAAYGGTSSPLAPPSRDDWRLPTEATMRGGLAQPPLDPTAARLQARAADPRMALAGDGLLAMSIPPTMAPLRGTTALSMPSVSSLAPAAARAVAPPPSSLAPAFSAQAQANPAANAPAPVGAYNPATLTPNQLTEGQAQGLSAAEALAVCGPAATVAFSRAVGRNPTLREATEMGRRLGLWNPSQGMAGPASEVRLLQNMGVPARLQQGVDWGRVAAENQAGRPVIIDTPGHYYTATAYDPATGQFEFGASAGVLKASGGRTRFRPEEIPSLGMGAPRSTILLGAG